MKYLELTAGVISLAILAVIAGVWAFVSLNTVNNSPAFPETITYSDEPVNPANSVQAPWDTHYLFNQALKAK